MTVLLPLLMSLAAGGLLLFLRGQSLRVIWGVSLAGAFAHLVSSLMLLSQVKSEGILSVQLGGWQAPFGISFVADTLTALMLSITGFVYLMGIIFAYAESQDIKGNRSGLFILIHFLVMGVTGAFTTGDYFNLYVWYEVMILSSFGLMVIGNEKFQLEGAFKYAILNFLASTLFLMGLGLLYGVVGSLNIADVTLKLMEGQSSNMALGAALLISVGFAMKSAIFPFYSWLPTAYHLPSFTASAVFAGLLTKVGVYSLFRLLGMSFQMQKDIIIPVFVVLSILTMLLGVFGAATRFHARKILSFHIISQIGYMTLALAFFTQKAFAAATFYLVHHIVVKTNLFFISGVIKKVTGSEDLSKTGGMLKAHPWVAVCFIISGFSLGGIPPLSGFFAKFAILKEGLSVQSYWAVGIGLFVGLLTLFSMTKIWAEAFWKEAPEEAGSILKTVPPLMMTVITSMALVTVWISMNPDVLMAYANTAAEQLVNPKAYIEQVLQISLMSAGEGP